MKPPKIPGSLSELGTLCLVRSDSLLLHEAHDPARLLRLRERIVSEGVQANPIIASRVGPAGSAAGFLVLDGAHRAETLRALGCRLALVQLVELPTCAEGWRHLIGLGASGPDDARSLLEKALSGSAEISEGRRSASPGSPGRPVAGLLLSGGVSLEVVAAGPGVRGLAAALWGVQNIYPGGSGGGVVRRLAPGENVEPSEGEVVISYRPFPTAGIVEEISAGRTLPAGVTRFTVPGRVLGVGMPIELLVRGDSSRARLWLDRKVAGHLGENRIRRYDEPVTLFE
ncbi:hypothetical protein [Rubrobacter indicoceani]|uniref:hypothetical protein n=1 Tax=Rubrobacter indicoceani TaxID=2051957 RepID=UPI000E5A78B8|nr:hypothetical protein [Rubrobacter indicoceani]